MIGYIYLLRNYELGFNHTLLLERTVSMKLKKLLAPVLVVALALAFVGCGNDTKTAADTTPKEIKIGATAGPHAQVAEAVAKEAAKQGITLKVVEFSDYITPDKALADGDIQLNAYQHVPFMENFNKQNNSKLVAIGKTILMPMGLYSNKIKSPMDIPAGSIVAVPNDPTNGGRGLALLAKAGIIKLKDGVGFKATPADIVSNPYNVKVQELEAAQLPRSLDDVTIAAIPMNYVQSAGLNVKEQGIFLEPKDEPLAVMILATREQDKDNATYRKIADIYQSETIKQFITDTFKGTITSAYQ